MTALYNPDPVGAPERLLPTPSHPSSLPAPSRKQPESKSSQILKLQNDPTEPPKSGLNGRNRPLNGAQEEHQSS